MSSSDLTLLGAVTGLLGALWTGTSVLVRWLDGRRSGRIEEHRLDLDGLRALVQEQREELDDLRAERRQDRREMDDLASEQAAMRRQLAKCENDREKLMLLVETLRP